MRESTRDIPDWMHCVARQARRRLAACGADDQAARWWVVAVSGGSDSVGLLLALHKCSVELGLQISVAHLDHGARGEAAHADAAFVADLAAKLDLPFDLGTWTSTRTGHFEADAREARLAWLTDVARTRGARFVALGHTLDDQAETVLHRIVRGTGLRGLAGIPTRRVLDRAARIFLVRPLLRTRRQDIRDRLDELGQLYREDASNFDVARTRARIRHNLLPKLAVDYNPRVVDALANLARMTRAATEIIDQRMTILSARVGPPSARDPELAAPRIVLNCKELRAITRFECAEVIRRIWRRAGWPERGMTAGNWRRLASIARGEFEQKQHDIGAGVKVEVMEGLVVLRRATRALPLEVTPPVALPVPGRVTWMGGEITTTLDASEPREEAVDLDKVGIEFETDSLWVRSPRKSDLFAPLGMNGQRKRLKDFLRERGVPRDERGRVPIVEAAGEVIWVVGHRIAEHVKLTAETKRVLYLRWNRGSEPSSTQP